MLRRTFFTAWAAGLLTLGVLTTPLSSAQEASSPVAGKWHFVFDTGSDVREFDAVFAVADGKVSGTFDKSEVKGSSAGSSFDLEFPSVSEEVGKGTLKMTGKEADGVLTGKWSFQTYDGTFRATRPKATAGATDTKTPGAA